MNITYKKFYLLSLTALVLASVYPIIVGAQAIISYISNGFVAAQDYGKYVIPYAPICISLITVFACFPLLYKTFRKFTTLFTTIIGLAIFIIAEIGFEQMGVVSGVSGFDKIDKFQSLLCYRTFSPIYPKSSYTYKIHFYIISILITITIIYLLNGFSKMFRDKVKTNKKPLIVQTCCVTAFIGLCILANFTSFFRTGNISVSPISAILTSLFFIVLSTTFGVYIGCLLFGKNRWLSNLIPSLLSSVMCIFVYIGELTLLGGSLYRFGSGFLFEPLGTTPFAIIDFIVILLSGVVTYLILNQVIPRNTVSFKNKI